jgi:hypothetical protein
LRYTIATSPPSTSLDFDHFFGLSILLDRFPGTRAIASPKSVKLMHEQLQTAAFAPRGHSTLGGDHLTLSAITKAPDGVETINTLVRKRPPTTPCD